MKTPYEIKHTENEILCPECGSLNISEDDTHTAETNNGISLKQYICKDCGIKFIPALISKNSKIHDWSKKIRTNEGLNEGKSWSNDNIQYIIIKKVQK